MSQLGILGMFHFRCAPGQEELWRWQPHCKSSDKKYIELLVLLKKLIYFHFMHN